MADKNVCPTNQKYTFALMVLPFFAIPLLIGCGSDKKAQAKYPPKPAAQQMEWESKPLNGAPTTLASTPVKEGVAPLVYMAMGPGAVRVVDVITGRTIARAKVVGGTIISVTDEAGVKIGEAKYVRGPLEPSRQYIIYLDTGGGSEIRTGTLKSPGPDPRPKEEIEQNAPPPRPIGP